MKIKISVTKVIFIIYMILVWDVFYSIFRINNRNVLVLAVALLTFLYVLYKYYWTNRIDRRLLRGFYMFIIPWLIVTVISCLSAIAIWHTNNSSDVTQSIARFGYMCSAFLISYIAVKIFGNKSIYFVMIAGIISYLTIFIQAINKSGLYGVIKLLRGELTGLSLEAHGYIEACGLIFLYYLLSDRHTRKERIKYCLILACIILLGGKRVVFLALIVTLIIYLILHKLKEKSNRIIKIVMALYFLIALLYLVLVKNGGFEEIFSYFGIADNSRLKFWNYFRNTYDISIFYFGRGISYTDNVMAFSSTRNALRLGSNVGIHNDILRTYIGWGFIPFVYYYLNLFLINTRRIIRWKKPEIAWKYYALIGYCFINYMVDYMITDIPFNICLFMICLLLLEE